MLYQKYEALYKTEKISTGFSSRLPDYSFKYWIFLLEQALIALPNKRNFLDVGAGNGRFTRLLSDLFESGVAIEVDSNQEEWNKLKKEAPNIILYEGFLQNIIPQLKTKHTQFDCIMLIEVFEHIPPKDIDIFVESLASLLDNEGTIFLTTPNFFVQGPAEKSALWHERFLYGHYKHYTVSEIKNIFEKYGFYLENISFEGHEYRKKKYNNFYFFIANWDAKFLNSKKIPYVLRLVYKYCSWPFIFLLKKYFQTLAQKCYFYETNANETNAETIILRIKKDSFKSKNK